VKWAKQIGLNGGLEKSAAPSRDVVVVVDVVVDVDDRGRRRPAKWWSS
jgi:hypothetical protein